jgi:DNA repair exonuclease SbcCD nuclease subunit
VKLLFTADIHIKLNQKNVPLEWSLNRYELLLDKLWELQENCELFVIGGDVFDKVPTMEELEIYFNLVASCRIKTIIYSGNHEALKKNTTFLSYLKDATSKINSLVSVIDDFYTYKNIDFIPYNKLKEWEKDPDNTFYSLHNHILCTHVRGEIPPHVKAEVDLDLFKRWKMVLAGDLHSFTNSQRNIVYPGSPVTTSFHRELVDTGVLVINTENLEYDWKVLDLPQLIRKTVKAGDELTPGKYHHIIYEVEGDLGDLSVLDDNELLDKKLVKKSVDTALILDNSMTLEQEVVEYLLYVLNLDEHKIEEVLKEYRTYASKF